MLVIKKSPRNLHQKGRCDEYPHRLEGRNLKIDESPQHIQDYAEKGWQQNNLCSEILREPKQYPRCRRPPETAFCQALSSDRSASNAKDAAGAEG